MPKPQANNRPLTQAERLARKDFLKNDVAKLERQIRDMQDQIASLLDSCEHTDGNGRTAVIGDRTKVCVHCGRIVNTHEKLWG
jgi:predicted  nucleic acid-binding Zn-ribbon protein